MRYNEPARTAARWTLSNIFTALVAVSATLIGVLIYQSLASSSSSAAISVDTLDGDRQGVPGGARPHPHKSRREGAPERAPRSGAAVAVPGGVSVFNDEIPALANLDPDLLAALRQAATDAADDDVEIFVNSGWRSPEYQEQLLREAIAKYGSEAEAARWVATPETSAHVSGNAVDIGPADAMAWLSEHGAEYGLCQIYRNEPWHYELRPEAIDHGCPPMYANPTQDPRMQQ